MSSPLLDSARGATGATAASVAAYGRALAAYLCWHDGVEEQLALALQESPGFVMAQVLQAYLRVCGRDPRRIQSARPLLEHAAGLRANEQERRHLAVIAAVLAGDYARATAGLDALLADDPHDLLALQVANTFDYFIGEAKRLLGRVQAVLPAWSADQPGYAAVQVAQAFALEECGEYGRAEDLARAALESSPFDVRAHHVMAHVFEMTDRADAGVRWMNEQATRLGPDLVFTTHCWWHLALFHLTLGRLDRALALYDGFIRAGRSADIADLIDAAALLWRVRLQGGDIGTRGIELAAAWAPHIGDGYCSFSDLHAMLAFVGAQDWTRAQRLEAALVASHSLPTRYGESTRLIGLPACRALVAFGRGDTLRAITLLASLPAVAQRLGGSHAQRDVLHLTLLQAIEHIRRPARSAASTLR